MASSNPRAGVSTNGGSVPERTYFEQQREALVGQITISLEQVLQNVNKLNRSFEGVIAVGNEFSAVEALWSQFENIMAKDPEDESGLGKDEGETVTVGGETTVQSDVTEK